MSKPYMPSNGAEGYQFEDAFCAHCWRDRAWRIAPDTAIKRQHGCKILGMALCGIQQKEWIQDDDGGNPRCTKFEEKRKRGPRKIKPGESLPGIES